METIILIILCVLIASVVMKVLKGLFKIGGLLVIAGIIYYLITTGGLF